MACFLEKKINKLEISWEKGVNKLKRIHVVEWSGKGSFRI